MEKTLTLKTGQTLVIKPMSALTLQLASKVLARDGIKYTGAGDDLATSIEFQAEVCATLVKSWTDAEGKDLLKGDRKALRGTLSDNDRLRDLILEQAKLFAGELASEVELVSGN